MTTRARKPARPKPTFDHLMSTKAPITQRDYFGCPDELLNELANARRALEGAKLRGHKEPDLLKAAQDRADEAREAVRESAVEVVMRSIGRARWDELMQAHPPTEAQKEKTKRESGDPNAFLEFNLDTFPPVAIAASCVQPEMTAEQATELWNSETWNEAECARLLQMALTVNRTRKTADLTF